MPDDPADGPDRKSGSIPNESAPERFRDYFKYISTVDAAAVVGALALRDRFGIEPEVIGLALVVFGISAYLCIIAMFVLTRTPHWSKGELSDWLVVMTFSITTTGVIVLVSHGVFD